MWPDTCSETVRQHYQRYVHLDDATLSQASERIAIAIERDLRTIQWRPKVYSSKTPGAGATPPSTGALP